VLCYSLASISTSRQMLPKASFSAPQGIRCFATAYRLRPVLLLRPVLVSVPRRALISFPSEKMPDLTLEDSITRFQCPARHRPLFYGCHPPQPDGFTHLFLSEGVSEFGHEVHILQKVGFTASRFNMEPIVPRFSPVTSTTCRSLACCTKS
jgi:hypothetical protein